MEKVAQYSYRSGCLISVLAPLLGVLLYPRAKWLFAFVLVGLVLLVLAVLNQEDPTPPEIANLADSILRGTSAGWDIDNYEHLNPKDHEVRELWAKTMELCGAPEEWPKLDNESKDKLRGLIHSIRKLGEQ
jgi:hypothetical protein